MAIYSTDGPIDNAILDCTSADYCIPEHGYTAAILTNYIRTVPRTIYRNFVFWGGGSGEVYFSRKDSLSVPVFPCRPVFLPFAPLLPFHWRPPQVPLRVWVGECCKLPRGVSVWSAGPSYIQGVLQVLFTLG